MVGVLAASAALIAASTLPAAAREWHPHGWVRPWPVYVAPRPVYVAPPPVYYVPPPVYYAPPVVAAPSSLNIVVPLRIR